MKRIKPLFRLQATIFATYDEVDKLCVGIRNKLTAVMSGEQAKTDIFAIELLLREALVNAVKHGCRENPKKYVHCVVRVTAHRASLFIADEGKGFDWKSQKLHVAKNTDTSGRGVSIYQAYATQFSFNEKGNAVRIVRKFK